MGDLRGENSLDLTDVFNPKEVASVDATKRSTRSSRSDSSQSDGKGRKHSKSEPRRGGKRNDQQREHRQKHPDGEASVTSSVDDNNDSARSSRNGSFSESKTKKAQPRVGEKKDQESDREEGKEKKKKSKKKDGQKPSRREKKHSSKKLSDATMSSSLSSMEHSSSVFSTESRLDVLQHGDAERRRHDDSILQFDPTQTGHVFVDKQDHRTHSEFIVTNADGSFSIVAISGTKDPVAHALRQEPEITAKNDPLFDFLDVPSSSREKKTRSKSRQATAPERKLRRSKSLVDDADSYSQFFASASPSSKGNRRLNKSMVENSSSYSELFASSNDNSLKSTSPKANHKNKNKSMVDNADSYSQFLASQSDTPLKSTTSSPRGNRRNTKSTSENAGSSSRFFSSASSYSLVFPSQTATGTEDENSNDTKLTGTSFKQDDSLPRRKTVKRASSMRPQGSGTRSTSPSSTSRSRSRRGFSQSESPVRKSSSRSAKRRSRSPSSRKSSVSPAREGAAQKSNQQQSGKDVGQMLKNFRMFGKSERQSLSRHSSGCDDKSKKKVPDSAINHTTSVDLTAVSPDTTSEQWDVEADQLPKPSEKNKRNRSSGLSKSISRYFAGTRGNVENAESDLDSGSVVSAGSSRSLFSRQRRHHRLDDEDKK